MQGRIRVHREPTPLEVRRRVRAILAWFRRNARDLPWRRTHDPYAVWVSEIMLQQTQVKTVIPYWERWMRELPTVESLARAREARVLRLWEGLGYYRRARNLRAAARLLVREHHGRFPTTFEDVLALPGVGRYTAGAVCSIAYNQPTPVLDGNVTRVLTRLLGLSGALQNRNNQNRLWGWADQLVRVAAAEPSRGRRNCGDLNQALMELGAVTCTRRNPRCLDCPLQRCCVAFGRTGAGRAGPPAGPPQHCPPPVRRDQRPRPTLRSDRFARGGSGPVSATASLRSGSPHVAIPPRWKRAQQPIAKHVVAVVVERSGRFLVRQRPAGGVNGRLWEFPNAEVPYGRNAIQRVIRQLVGGGGGGGLEKLLRVKHAITRYRITLDTYRVRAGRIVPLSRRAPGAGTSSPTRWCSLAQLHRLAFPSAHRRIVDHLRQTAGRTAPSNQ